MKVLFRKTMYKQHFEHRDKFGSVDDEKRKFEYEIEVNKCYALNGITYEIRMPNCTMHDKNFGRLIAEAIEYAASKFPQSFRLEDELRRKGIWNSL